MSRRSEAFLPHSGAVVSGDHEHVARAVETDRRQADEQAAWIVALRSQGVKAAHPDDGWVNRDEGKIHLCYPQFNDGLGVGDLLALGSPGGETRLVQIMGSSENRFAMRSPRPWYWHFESVSTA